MQKIIHNKREFQIIQTEPISNYPALAANQPEVESHFIAQGKKGALISGYITKDGRVIIH